MSNIPITPGTGVSSVATETISGNDYQKVKIVDGTGGSTNAWIVNSDGTANIRVSGSIATTLAAVANQSVSGTVGASVIGTVPVVQSGAWSASVMGGPVTLYAPTTSLVSAVSSVITGTASITVLVGAPGGQRNYITHILATNAAAAGTFVNICDGGNVVYSGYAAASGGGFSATLPAPLRQASAQGALCISTPTQASVVVAVSGFTAS